MQNNLHIWSRVFNTPPNATKEIHKSVFGFAATAVDPMYVVETMTTIFGPIGIGWGVEVVSEELRDMKPVVFNGETHFEKHHFATVRVWVIDPENAGGEKSYTMAIGQTPAVTLVNSDKGGQYWKVNNDAGKSSVTDAVTKIASWLGVGGDVHTGMYDDNKYLQQLEDVDRSGKVSAIDQMAEQRQKKQALDTQAAELFSVPAQYNASAVRYAWQAIKDDNLKNALHSRAQEYAQQAGKVTVSEVLEKFADLPPEHQALLEPYVTAAREKMGGK